MRIVNINPTMILIKQFSVLLWSGLLLMATGNYSKKKNMFSRRNTGLVSCYDQLCCDANLFNLTSDIIVVYSVVSRGNGANSVKIELARQLRK